MKIAQKDIGKIRKNTILCGIYKITSPTKKVYIGQSVNIYSRYCSYKRAERSRKQRALYNSFKKHGVKNHTFEIIEECDFEQLNIRERYWQDYYDVLNGGLNCMLTDDGENKTKYRYKRNKAGLKVINVDSKKTYKTIKEASEEEGVNESLLRQYLNGVCKNKTSLILERDLKKGLLPDNIFKGKSRNRKVIDVDTNIIYNTAKEASESCSIGLDMLYKCLTRVYRNPTSLMYLSEYRQGKSLWKKEAPKPPKKKTKKKVKVKTSNQKPKNPINKKVIDVLTNIEYRSLREACRHNNINSSTLSSYLLGRFENKTSMIYLSDYKKGLLPHELHIKKYRYYDVDNGKKFNSYSEAAKHYNINRNTLYWYVSNEMWHKTNLRKIQTLQ